jgi:hypothetical protein
MRWRRDRLIRLVLASGMVGKDVVVLLLRRSRMPQWWLHDSAFRASGRPQWMKALEMPLRRRQETGRCVGLVETTAAQ